MKYDVYYAQVRGERFFSFMPKSHRYKEGYVKVASSMEAYSKEHLFRNMQSDFQMPEFLKLKIRSMSVGDIIHCLDNNKYYVVDMIGFAEIDGGDEELFIRVK